MSMSKKDFIELADVIKEQKGKGVPYEFSADQIGILGDFCAGQNPMFMRGRWESYINGACGKNGGKVK